MTTTGKELRAILVMQAEILGRLEALEQALATSGDPMADRLATITGLSEGITYEDPRLEALHKLCEQVDAGDDLGLSRALDDLVAAMKDR